MKHTVTVTFRLENGGTHCTERGDSVVETAINHLEETHGDFIIKHSALKHSHCEDGTQYRFLAVLLNKSTAHAARTIIESLDAYADAAVVLDINTTTDTGLATYYSIVDGHTHRRDTFQEREAEHGTPKGEHAAEHMHKYHGIPAIASWGHTEPPAPSSPQ